MERSSTSRWRSSTRAIGGIAPGARSLPTLIRRKSRRRPTPRILEIGCGTGHNLEMLGQFGRVDGIELDDQARAIAEQRLGRQRHELAAARALGGAGAHYDLIGAFDVIEHIDDDTAALKSIATS